MPGELVVSAFLDPSPSSLASRPSTLYFRASYTDSLRPHATTCFPSRAQSHQQISVAALTARRRREALTRPAVLEYFLGNEGVRWGAGVNRHTTAEEKYQMSLPCMFLDGSSGLRLHVSCTRRGNTTNWRSGRRRCDGRWGLRCRCLSLALLLLCLFPLVAILFRSPSNIQRLDRDDQTMGIRERPWKDTPACLVL